MGKLGPFWIGKTLTLQNWRNKEPFQFSKIEIFLNRDQTETKPDWRNKDPSGLAILGPFRIGEIVSLPDLRVRNSFSFVKRQSFQIGETKTLPDRRKRVLSVLPK